MIFKSVNRLAVGKKIFHIAKGNELIETSNIEGHEQEKIALMYIEENVLHIVSKDAQYIADYFSYKNIES